MKFFVSNKISNTYKNLNRKRLSVFQVSCFRLHAACRARAGFTLLELLLYIALVGVVAVATVHAIITLNRTIAVFRIERRLTANAEFAVRRLAREIRLANEVYASSTLGVSPSILSMASVESETDATPVDAMVQFEDGVLALRRGTNDALRLTGDTVTVSRLVFWKMDNAAISQAVKVEMTLTAASGGVSKSRDYYTTVLLRGAY